MPALAPVLQSPAMSCSGPNPGRPTEPRGESVSKRRVVRITHASAASMLLVCMQTGACQRSRAPAPTSSALPSASARPSAAPRGPKALPAAGDRIDIPGGAWFAGSTPGELGRVPELEPRRYSIELGPFQIDRLAYPNDPQKAATTSVTRDEARRLCADRGARLCTELEWERACKGPSSEKSSSGEAWDERCREHPERCASGFEVLGMGALREWTASDVLQPNGGAPLQAVLRGAAKTAPPSDRRCAARTALPPSATEPDLGFRCCAGAPNAAVVPEPKLGATFQKVRLTASQLEKIFAKDPRTEALAKDIRFFKEPDSAETVVARGPGDRKGFTFTVSPLLWNPVAGARFLLVAARSGENRSFVVAFHALDQDQYLLAASFVMDNEPGPVAFAYDEFIRPRLHFSSCWGCSGETGKILFRKPERVAILQP